jgi:hypothetical protein
MRVMVIVTATRQTESGELPTKELFEEMGKFNEELVKAKVMLAGEGLHPSSRGVRVKFSGKDRSVVEGPFTPTEGMVAGFWIWRVNSMDEAIAWAKRCPNPTGIGGTLEIRQIQEMEDFQELLGPDAKRREEHMRHQLAGIACNCN